ncbi:helix-turn-helix domain-containing protein [Enterococcus hulanensis]|uniref:helix-turn-helix domain-containing protein n=1 Tax=Enterococcus hulanensis TaxID=2559929 RepID=UPI001A8D7A43|nr:helix-turn-helix domain-containing protein [Enterococcus hulanensis]MBO0459657.1 helix-turn-helix domain-containing protein [Enterococcus hulanensis]
MTRILLLTKNIFNEDSFEKQLRQLGNEVFTSASLVEGILCDLVPDNFLSMYHQVIFSETIDTKEVASLVSCLKRHALILLRKTDEHLNEKQTFEWKELGLTDWIDCHPTLETLRDQLTYDQPELVNTVVLPFPPRKSIDISSLPLSIAESKLLTILYQHQKVFASREALCIEMWGKPKTNSTMSQLSTLVSKLKRKLEEYDLTGEIIETSWGQGYRLEEQTYQQLHVGNTDKMLVHEVE